jgi:hypothetical protein
MWLGGLPLVAISAMIVGVVGLVVFSIVRSTIPGYVYQDTFHEKPSADVQHLRSQVWSFADESHQYIRFEANPETFHRIVPKAMEKVSYAEYKEQMSDGHLDPPSWWQPPSATTSEIYLRRPGYGQGDHFASETMLMTYDVSTKTAHYFCLGID